MRNIVCLVLIASLVVAPAAAVTKTGHETEEDPYCEPAYNDSPGTPGWQPGEQPRPGEPNNGGPNQPQPAQPSIGYGRLGDLNREIEAGPYTLRETNCEGEHWDGQDHEGAEHGFANNPNDPNNPCSGQWINAMEAEYNFALWQCANPDNGPVTDLTKPVGARFTSHHDEEGNPLAFAEGYAYLGLRVFAVGRTAAYVSFCRSEEGPGSLEAVGPTLKPGEACTDGRTGETPAEGLGRFTVAWYGQDDTPLNVLTTAISAARVTRGFPADGDCTQAHYQHQAANDPVSCGRDNTAITFEILA